MDIPGEVIIGGATVLSIVGGGAIWLFGRGGKDATVALQAATAEREAVAAKMECASLLLRVHEHEKACAVMFARLESVAQGASQASRESENRMTMAVSELKRVIENLSDRLDGLFQQAGVQLKRHS